MKTLFLTLSFFFTVFITFAQSDIQPAVDWVNKNAIPLKTVDAENGFDDLDKLDAAIGDARIVAMGECTHGSSEIFRMKHRMFEYLVTKKGFTIFSIEASMAETYTINDYIINGKGDSKKSLTVMSFWTWNTQEVLDLIEWMKKYNDSAKTKVMFTGFDMQTVMRSTDIVRKYLKSELPDALYLLEKYDSVVHANITNPNFRKALYPALKNTADEIMTTMSKEQAQWNNKDFKRAFQNAKILWQYGESIQYKLHEDKGFRDKCMADNLEWIAEENPDAKIMIWAHNDHIMKSADQFGELKMGYHLAKAFGKKYTAIGFSTEEGTYTAVNRKTGNLQNDFRLTESKKGSAEFILKNARPENYLLDLRKAEQGNEGALWIFGKIKMRDLGARDNEKFQFTDFHPFRDYDMVIFLKHTNSSKCFNVK